MPTSINKLAPQAILLAVAIYWCWPALKQTVSTDAPAASKGKKAEVAMEFSAAILSPTFPPPATRNPFEFPDAKPSATAKSGKRGANDADEKAVADIKDSGLVLNGTCIMGQQRLAIINGRVYREKELIRGQGEDPVNWAIINIFPHKVLLSCQGTPLQLTYANVAGTRTASRAKAPAVDKSPQKPTK